MGVDVLSNNDGIIHKNPQCHDKSKQRNHIDAFAGEIEYHECRHKRYRDSGGNPKCKTKIEKKGEDQKNQNHSLNAISKQKIDPAFNHWGYVPPDSDFYPFGGRILFSFNIIAYNS